MKYMMVLFVRMTFSTLFSHRKNKEEKEMAETITRILVKKNGKRRKTLNKT